MATPRFTNVTPAVKWQVNALPQTWSLSVVTGVGHSFWLDHVFGSSVR